MAVCPVGTWCVESAPAVASGLLLHAVFAVTAEDVFAVGDAGTVLRRTNDTWSAMPRVTNQNLRGLWASSSSDVWASGGAGTILRFNGSTWSQISTTTTSDLDAVWGSGPSDVWFAGGGTVLRWNGSSFTSFGFGGTLLAISGTGPNDVWVTGENTHLQHFTGSGWTTVNSTSGSSTSFAVAALATNDVWATNFLPGRETMHFTGNKWVAVRTGSAIFNSLSARAANDIWGVGGNKVGRWNGSAWAVEQPFGTTAPPIWSVTTVPGNAWLVGSNALIAHRSF